MKRHLTYANVMATFAVFVALGGSAYAGVVLSKNSVRSQHIRNGQVKRADLAARSVISSKVADGSLLAQDFRAGQLPAGPAGPAGQNGATSVRVRYSTSENATQNDYVVKTAACRSGERATGGGGAFGGGWGIDDQVLVSFPSASTSSNPELAAPANSVPDSWTAGAINRRTFTRSWQTYVVCAAP